MVRKERNRGDGSEMIYLVVCDMGVDGSYVVSVNRTRRGAELAKLHFDKTNESVVDNYYITKMEVID